MVERNVRKKTLDKILRIIEQEKEIFPTTISKKYNIDYQSVKTAVEWLEDLGVIETEYIGEERKLVRLRKNIYEED